ncbi:hypothetical protein N7530_007364 [Penicillium desertorum]|uniref:Uncharacterized protein n=1 Tax=Penicillium desertorum TaxID=1303715 RepID=A0A9W9WMA3_9EURO|nr:hypothetical protein N7530_007364 [Penicillium desertorum]
MSTSIASGLFKSLPKPKYTGEEEELPPHAQPRGPRVVGADQIDETQVVLRRTGPPPTETVQDGDLAPPKISGTAARSPRF